MSMLMSASVSTPGAAPAAPAHAVPDAHTVHTALIAHAAPTVTAPAHTPSDTASQKPLIALTPYYNLDTGEPYMRPAYPEAILHAGGIPVVLPLTSEETVLQQLTAAFDAFLFTGGPDIHPFYFHEEAHARCGNISPKRDSMELLLLKLAMKAQKPILAICRGIQLLNIGLGGDIYQDIQGQRPAGSAPKTPADISLASPAASEEAPSDVPPQFPSEFPLAHSQPFAYDLPSHTVSVSPHTLLAKLTQPDASGTPLPLKVNSMHHQAVRRLAPGLIVSGYASDGIIEAIENPDYPAFFLGLQWHPEYLWKQDEAAARIFTGFVRASRCRCN